MSTIGEGNDAVRLVFAGNDSRIFTSYNVRKSILTQPSQFKVRMGWGGVARELIKKLPPKTPFELYINERLQQTGETDGFHAHGGATELDISGRDVMARLHDAYVKVELSFTNDTFTSLTRKVLDINGMKDKTIDSDNQANRKLSSGVGLPDLAPVNTVDEIEPDTSEPTNKNIKRSMQAKLGETWLQFLTRQYRRAGVFLWAKADGNFVLGEPNSQQPACARIIRKRGQLRNTVSATGAEWRNETTNRFSEAVVYSRGSSRKYGRAHSNGAFVDDEMFNYGYDRPIVYRDVNVQTTAQAEFYCRRKLAEYARAGWSLVYTVPGHTVNSLITKQPMVWTPDTLVEVDDDEYGLHDTFYVEEVTFTRPPTQTQLTLMRTQHLIFASDEGND